MYTFAAGGPLQNPKLKFILTQAFFQAQEITRELQIVLKCDSQSVLVAFSTAGKRKSENESYLKVPEGT